MPRRSGWATAIWGPSISWWASSGRKRGLCRRAKRVLEESLREARRLGDRHIGSEHVLLGINAVESGQGAQILRDLGASSDSVRTGVLEELRRAS